MRWERLWSIQMVENGMWTMFVKLMQSRENEKTDKRSEPLEGKCDSIYAELEFPGRK